MDCYSNEIVILSRLERDFDQLRDVVAPLNVKRCAWCKKFLRSRMVARCSTTGIARDAGQ